MNSKVVDHVDHAVPFQTDTIVRRLDEFPELLAALRDSDFLTARSFCAQMFNLDGRTTPAAPKPASTVQIAMRAF
jgi:hypothetical protein